MHLGFVLGSFRFVLGSFFGTFVDSTALLGFVFAFRAYPRGGRRSDGSRGSVAGARPSLPTRTGAALRARRPARPHSSLFMAVENANAIQLVTRRSLPQASKGGVNSRE
jgi:hypothetical protein